MSYNSVDELPSSIKKYSGKVSRQYMHVYNSVYERTNSKESATAAANSVLKKRVESHSINQDADYFNGLVDIFLGNL